MRSLVISRVDFTFDSLRSGVTPSWCAKSASRNSDIGAAFSPNSALALMIAEIVRFAKFAISAEEFDNGLIVRPLANEETSAKGSHPYGETG